MIVKLKNPLFAAGLGILLISNIFVLAGVAYNRSGEPLAQVMLTERELNLPYSYGFRKENSGISFNLDWRVYTEDYQVTGYGYYGGSYSWVSWLNADKLQQLGFDTSYPLHETNAYRSYRDQPDKQVFIVMEYDGVYHQKIIEKISRYILEKESAVQQASGKEKERLKNQLATAREHLKEEMESQSRLYAIDAVTEMDELAVKYPDRKKYLVMPGKIRISLRTNEKKQQILSGQITEMSNDSIHVPLQFRSELEKILNDKKIARPGPPRFRAEIAWGKKLEPWIVKVETL